MFGQLQQTHAPGLGGSVFLGAEQETGGRSTVGPDQHRLAGLEDLVADAAADGSKVLPGVVLACGGDGLVQNVLDGSHRQALVDEVRKQRGDAAPGAGADPGEAANQLP